MHLLDVKLLHFMQDPSYLYDVTNETAGALVPAQIIYDAFHGRYHDSTGAIVFLIIIWGSFFFCGLSVTACAARVVRENHLIIHFFFSYQLSLLSKII